MRIIGGLAGGTILKVPKGYDVRPTPDLVRQALFNSLGDRVQGARVLELFGGTGALTLECLSRGAVQAVCVEKVYRHAQVIRKNLAHCGLPESSLELRTQDVATALPQLVSTGRQFELILADPPYGVKNLEARSRSFAQQMLDHPDLPRLLAAHGFFILGHTKRDRLTIPEIWEETKELRHGDTTIRFFRLRSS